MQINKDARAGTKQRDTRTDSRTQPDMDPHTSVVTDTQTETHRGTHTEAKARSIKAFRRRATRLQRTVTTLSSLDDVNMLTHQGMYICS